jgi:c-di-GMP-binding flagellar brake protein YcgR
MASVHPAAKWDIKPEYAKIYEIGQRVDLIVLGKGEPKTYGSLIQDLDEKQVVVSTPTYKGASVHVDIGGEITVSSFVGGACYMGSGKVRKRETSPLDILFVDRPTAVRRVQLRSSFRLDIEIPDCKLHVLPSSDSKVRYELDAWVSNLSAGGARMKLDKKVPSSEIAPSVRYFLEFPLDMNDPLGDRRNGDEGSEDEDREPPELVSASCKIIDVVEAGKGDNIHYIGRCAFIDPSPHLQDRITRFVNQGQMVLRRRRLV